MPDAYLDKGLGVLRAWMREQWPGIVIGWIGDARHDPSSDHSPESDGSVDAIDAMIGGRFTTAEARRFVDRLVATRDRRIAYIIFDRRILSSTVRPWVWRRYSGRDPHTNHVHISVNDRHENDTSDWGLDVAFKDEKIPLTATAGRELYQPDRPENTQVLAHSVLQTAAIYGQRAAANTASIIKTQAAQSAQLALILAAVRAPGDDAAVVAQGDRVVAAIEAVDVTSEVDEIKVLLAETGASAELAPVIAALDALPARILSRVAASQDRVG